MDLSLARIEDLFDDIALLIGKRLMAGDEIHQLLFRHILTPGIGIDSEEADDSIGRSREEPDQRAKDFGDVIYDDGKGWCKRLSLCERDALRDQFTEDEREVRDDECKADE